MKNNLLCAILCLGLLITFFGCQKDSINDHNQQINFKVQTLSFKKLQSLNFKAARFVEEFNNKSIEEGLSARTTEIYGKTVDTVSINYLEKDDGYSSTTLKVKNDSIGLNHFENMVIENYPNGSQSVKLIKYNLTKSVELIDSTDELNNSISSSEVSVYSNQANSFSRLDCIEVGYYKEVDKCEGQLVTPENEPWCFNDDDTPATITIFVTIDEDCTWVSGGGGGNNGGGTGNNGNPNGGSNNTSGGSYNGSGIFVPNIYSGEEDPTNPDYVLAGEVGVFFNSLPQNLQNLTNGNTWVYAYTVDYFRNTRGGVNDQNSQHVEDAFSNFETFKTNYYKSSRSAVNNDRLFFWAFYSFLNNNQYTNPDSTQQIMDIGALLLGADSNTDESVINYLFLNHELQNVTDLYTETLLEGNSPDVSECISAGGTVDDCIIAEITECIGTENITDLQQLSPTNISAITNFISANDCDEENIAFIELAIEALDNDGEVDFENKIIKDESFISTKADCVLNELINSENNIFKTASEAFTNNNSKYRLYFTVGNVQGAGAASASLPFDDGIIRITFDSGYVNSMTAMVTAKEILHETIHAELHRIYLDGNEGPNSLPQDRYDWYISLWEFFENEFDEQGYVASYAEHTYMANYFIDNIANGLRAFDNYTHPVDHYFGFAWEGLEEMGIEANYITQSQYEDYVELNSIIENDDNDNNCD